MSGRRAVSRTALVAGVVCAALLSGPAVAGAAVPGTGGGSGSGSGLGTGLGTGPGAVAGDGGSGPTTFPGLSQRMTGARDGCRKGNGRTTDRTPWPQAYLRPDRVWPLTEGAGVTVAVVGSGVDDAAGVLGGRLERAPRQFDAGREADCSGHGTFAAGLIAAARTPGAGFAGIAPRARVLSVGVTDRSGNTTAELLAKGIRIAADRGARVIAVVAVAGEGSGALRNAVRYATGKGAVLVAPVAPDAQTKGVTAYPAAYPEVVSVAATGPAGLPAGGSADGGAPSARVDLVAPGTSVMGTGPGGKGYFTASGPSYAAAFVAGSAALVSGYRPELTGAQLAHRLRATASRPGSRLPDPLMGWGTVDPVAAVTAVLPEERAGAAAPARPAVPPAAMPPRPGPSALDGAWPVVAGAVAGTAAVAAAGFVLPAGRRRKWAPGRHQA
ncbi:S8 family serine peptidase [Streptomyces sp. NPDC090025]|uniref:S8 family serine peptidase n=1 Tax=Streptomyces sp. NPDC090025 TaxID=3365922 RepID=UPI003837691D